MRYILGVEFIIKGTQSFFFKLNSMALPKTKEVIWMGFIIAQSLEVPNNR